MSWRDRIFGIFRRKKAAPEAAADAPEARAKKTVAKETEEAPVASKRSWREKLTGLLRRKKSAPEADEGAPEANDNKHGDEAAAPKRSWRDRIAGIFRRKKPAAQAEAASKITADPLMEGAKEAAVEASEGEAEPEAKAPDKRGWREKLFGFLRRKKAAAPQAPEGETAGQDKEAGEKAPDGPHPHIVLAKMVVLVLCVIGAAVGVGWFILKNYPALTASREPPAPVKPAPIEPPVKPISIAPPASAVLAVAPASTVPERAVDFIKPSALASAPQATETPAQKAPVVKPPVRMPPVKPVPAGPLLSLSQQADNAFRRAAALERQGDANGALAGYDDALRLDSGHLHARGAKAALLLKQGRLLDAEHTLQDGLKLDSSNTDFAMRLARMQLARNAVWSALLTLQKSESYAAQQADYQALMAEVLARVGHHKEAVKRYQNAVQLSPASGVWFMELGVSLHALQRDDEAKAAFLHARDSHKLNAGQEAQVEQWLKAMGTN